MGMKIVVVAISLVGFGCQYQRLTDVTHAHPDLVGPGVLKCDVWLESTEVLNPPMGPIDKSIARMRAVPDGLAAVKMPVALPAGTTIDVMAIMKWERQVVWYDPPFGRAKGVFALGYWRNGEGKNIPFAVMLSEDENDGIVLDDKPDIKVGQVIWGRREHP